MDRTTIEDAVFPNCPIQNILARLCEKWSLQVVYTLTRPGEMSISLCHSLVFPGEVFLGRAADFFLEEAQEMLRILEAEHVGDLLHACLRLEQGVLRSFDYLELDVLSRGTACLRLHQISEIVGRKAYLVGEVLHRWQSVQLRHAGIPVVIEQPLETHEHVVVQFLARDELAFVETHAVVEQDLDVRWRTCR